MDKAYYVRKYEDRMDEIYVALKEEDVWDIDYACTVMFDETANAEEVVGYYLTAYEWNPLDEWMNNLRLAEKVTDQDIEVTRILTELCEY